MDGDFYGMPTYVVRNDFLQLEFLAQAGPRIVRLYMKGSDDNLLAEVPNAVAETPFGPYRFIGGHRLWHAPEAIPRTIQPDNDGLQIEEKEPGVAWRLIGPPEPAGGLQKSIEIRLHPDRAALTLTHEINNQGLWPLELAPWALTQLALGGVAVFPQTTTPLDADAKLPNRHLVLWPYTNWNDLRLEVDNDYVLIRATPQMPPCKIGYLNRQGWMGYLNKGVFLVQRFTPELDKPHVDFGCNTESYVNNQFIELECLGPLQRLEPGQSVTLMETWDLYSGLEPQTTLAGIRKMMAANAHTFGLGNPAGNSAAG